jgi:hypothetical protein
MEYRVLDCTGFTPKEIEDGINYYATDNWRVICPIDHFLVLERYLSTPIPIWNIKLMERQIPIPSTA